MPTNSLSTGEPLDAVQLRDVHFAYRADRPVLRGVDWRIPAGAFVGIVGPNGAGKTSLLHVIAGLLTPSRGDVCLNGRRLAAMTPKQRARRVALVGQEGHAPFDFPVRDVVAMGRYPYHGRFSPLSDAEHALVDRCLELLDVAEHAATPLSRLSGGERQRVALARALAQTPRVLLLDEATAHLDVRHVAQVARLLRALHRELGLTIVAVLHDLAQAAALCPTLALLHDGRIDACGPPAEVLTSARLSVMYGLDLRVERDAAARVYVGPAADELALSLPAELREGWP